MDNQEYPLGVSMYSTVPQEYRLGINFGLTRSHLYLDISNNLAQEEEKKLVLQPGRTINVDKRRVGFINIGYNFYINDVGCITPLIGYGQSFAIYEDPIIINTYCNGPRVHHFNIGLHINFKMSDTLGCIMGAGYRERAKICLVYNPF